MELIAAYPWQMWLVFATITLAMIFYAFERVPLELTAIAALAFLILLFQLFPPAEGEHVRALTTAELLAGFANPALISILALLVIGQGLFQSEALEGPTRLLIRAAGQNPRTTLVLALAAVLLFSAFMNNTPVAVTFIPVLAALAQRTGQVPAQVMMPLSFACILGGMTTLIGSSTNLLAAQSARAAGLEQMGIFDITMPGLMLALPGFAYILFVMPRLLPRGVPRPLEEAAGRGRQYITQITLGGDNPLIGTRTKAGLIAPLKDMTVLLIRRGWRTLLPPFEEAELMRGDILVIAATRQTLTEALKSRSDIFGLPEREDWAEIGGGGGRLALIEAIVPPASRVLGRAVDQVTLWGEKNFLVLGIQRRSRMLRAMLTNIYLDSGDVLLLLGPREGLRDLGRTHDLLPLEWSSADLPAAHHSRWALAILGGAVGLMAAGLLPIVVAALLGATAMIAAGVLNIRQAARAIDRRVFVLVASALGMAAALEASGGAHFIAESAVGLFAGAPPSVILSLLFLIVAIATNVISNNAAAVLFTPIAINTAIELGAPPGLFVVTVILAANCSFATPIAYQTNLLVMGPGHYRFKDYLIAGAPLAVLLWLVYSLLMPFYYGIGG